MPTYIDTASTLNAPFGQCVNNRVIDVCSNGVIWAVFPPNTSGGSPLELWRSSDGGVTFVQDSAHPDALNARNVYSFFIDEDDYAHLVVYHSGGELRYRRGTPNAGRTSWTWSASLSISSLSIQECDIIAFRKGTGWVAHIVYSYYDSGTSNYNSVLVPFTISSSGVFALTGAIGLDSVNDNPSINFQHSGNGKSVGATNPPIFVAWRKYSPSVVEMAKFEYQSGTDKWAKVGATVGLENAGVTNFLIDSIYYDGILYVAYNISGNYVRLARRNIGASTTSLGSSPSLGSNDLRSVSITYDGSGNIRVLAVDNPNNDCYMNTYNIAGNSWGSWTLVDADNHGMYSARFQRGNASSFIPFVRGEGPTTDQDLYFDKILLNATPNVPTALTVTSDVLDTTPTFSADISDPDTSQQIKGRFQIYQSDGTTLVGSVDSALRTGAGSVTAEYASALPVGTYKVQVATVDDAGAISAYTAQVMFNVKTQVTDDLILRWDVDELILDSLELKWNVVVSNQKDFNLSWNVRTQVQANDLTLRWSKYTPWVNVDPDPQSPVTWEEVLA